MSPYTAEGVDLLAGTTTLDGVWDLVAAAESALDRTTAAGVAPASDDDDDHDLGATLDEVAAHLDDVEILLEGLARKAESAEDARELRSIREAVSVHLSAAASLRHLELDDKAVGVLRRATDSVRDPMAHLDLVRDIRVIRQAG